MSASSPTQSAMDRGVDFWKIVASAGLLLVGALYMVDPLELLSFSLPRFAEIWIASLGPTLLITYQLHELTSVGSPVVEHKTDGDSLDDL